MKYNVEILPAAWEDLKKPANKKSRLN